ncbi:MAG: DUF4960 domain-containing protein [Rikenellaceae bacterium]|nr:DUF4960 domain-containing protein [Rikenellaceae bacterium]
MPAEVAITGFSIEGVAGTIDNDKMEIEVVLPPATDVTMVAPVVEVSEGATVTPPSGMVQNFTGPVTYTVVNGSLYNEYIVNVEVIDAMITSFIVDGKYQGSVNNLARTVTVTVPYGTDLSSVSAYVEYTDGAALSPATGGTIDLRNPVTYTLSYQGYDFVYTVTASQRDEAFAFVGYAPHQTQLPGDEKAAFEWMDDNYANCHYISFQGIRDGSVNLADYDVIWWHYYEPNYPFEPVAPATDPEVVQAFKDYINGGGGLYLSTFACEYVVNLGITVYSPFNKFGNSLDPIGGPDVGEWGISADGNYDHPVFQNLDMDFRELAEAEGQWQREHQVVMLQGPGVNRSNKGCLWNLEAGETIEVFRTVEEWNQVTGGIGLGSFDWDGYPLQRIALAEFPRIENGRGPVFCNGAASYEWWNCGDTGYTNSRRGNLETLTKNIIDHLRK